MTGPASHDNHATAAAQVRQLCDPFQHHEAVTSWDRHRNQTVRIITSDHPPLLDQLAEAVATSRHRPDTRGPKPGSRVPINVDAIDRYRAIHRGLTDWLQRLHHQLQPNRSTGDTAAKHVLRALVDALPNLAPAIADELAADIDTWWRWAATQAGWRHDDLRKDL